jgi:heme-degrading monooxygenase HmoA
MELREFQKKSRSKIMIIKWIVCKVPHGKKEEFSCAQEEWKALKGVNGFRGQIGGWDLKHNSDACVLGIWEDFESYKHFMDNIHDQIFHKNNQKRSYESISVTLFESLFDIPGVYNEIYESLSKGKILRVADTTIYDNREQDFIKVQKEIWNPGMNKASGMYSGVFSKGTRTLNRYLVTTLWEDERSHQKYVETILPLLRHKAEVEKDISFILGRLILLDDKWSVIS